MTATAPVSLTVLGAIGAVEAVCRARLEARRRNPEPGPRTGETPTNILRLVPTVQEENE